MTAPSKFATRETLLGRLRAAPDDPAAWSEFVAWYGGKIYAWCRGWGLQESDAQDVTQEVFVNLSVRMHDFRYDPSRSFRAWLKTLTHHAWRDYLEKQRRPGRGSGSESAMERLAAVEAQEDLAFRLAEAFDQELLKEAARGSGSASSRGRGTPSTCWRSRDDPGPRWHSGCG